MGIKALITIALLTISFNPFAFPQAACTEQPKLFGTLSTDSDKLLLGMASVVTGNAWIAMDQNCGGSGRSPVPDIYWSLDVPPNSKAVLQSDPAHPAPQLVEDLRPDVGGHYVVHMILCPKTCEIEALKDYRGPQPSQSGSLYKVYLSPLNVTLQLDVSGFGQVPPNYYPDPAPSLLAATLPQHWGYQRDFCSSPKITATGFDPEWYSVPIWVTPQPSLVLLEGHVYDSIVSRTDDPISHNVNDVNAKIEPDPYYRNLLVDDTPEDLIPGVLPYGGMESEWEWEAWPEGVRPMQNDRISVLGYHIVDCGHTRYTEIHPPIAVAVHRPMPVLLPTSLPSYEDVVNLHPDVPGTGGPVTSAQSHTATSEPRVVGTDAVGYRPAIAIPATAADSVPVGTNVIVPGIITDIWANLYGGAALDCNEIDQHQTRLVSQTIYTPSTDPSQGTVPETVLDPPCVPQTPPGNYVFKFHVFLPRSPYQLLLESGVTNPAHRPALYTAIIDSPDAPSTARKDLPVSIIEKVVTGDSPYITVSVDLSSLQRNQSFAKRLVSAWVYPDITGKNFGLTAARLRIDSLTVTNTGDPDDKPGDWHLWIGVPSPLRPWTRLIDCSDCAGKDSYGPLSPIFTPGSLYGTGELTGEVLWFEDQQPRIRMTGYESDVIKDDDVGEIDGLMQISGTGLMQSQCSDQSGGGVTDEFAGSGCAAYTITFSAEPGLTPTSAVLSAPMTAFLNQLEVGHLPPTNHAERRVSNLYLGSVGSQVESLTSNRKDTEVEIWHESITNGVLANRLKVDPGAATYVETLRQRALKLLGPNPTPQQRSSVRNELETLKPLIPSVLYQKYLCDLETGVACSGAH